MTIEIETMNKDLPCDLSGEELQDRGDRLARALIEADDVEEERLRVVKGFKLKLENLAYQVGELKKQIKSKTEKRPIECSRRFSKQSWTSSD